MVNIWSHLLGFCFFVVVAVYDNLIVIPDLRGSVSDHLFVTLALICFQVKKYFLNAFFLLCINLPYSNTRNLIIQ